jgi:hypothetical protein
MEQIGPYTVNLQGDGFYSTGSSSAAIAAGVRNLYRDYYYNNSPVNGEGIVLSLGGFEADKQYDVTLWSYDADQIFTPTPTLWSPFGTTSGNPGSITNFATPYPTTLSDRSTTLQLTSSSGTLDIFGTSTGGGGGTRLNAVQVKDGATNLMALDFGRTSQPPSPVQTGFTGLGGEVAEPTFIQSVGAFTVSLEGQGFFHTTSGNENLVDASVRDFYRDYYFNNATTPGQGVKLTIDGVTPNTDYNLTLWTYDADNFSPTPTTWTPTGATTGPVGNVTNRQSPYPSSLAEYQTTIRVRSTTSSLVVFGTLTEGTGGTRLNGFELAVAPAGVDGDFNDNAVVDAGDYVVWRKNEGTANTLPHDPVGGTIGSQQYSIWRTNFGRTPGSGSAVSGSSVPEPDSLFLLLTIVYIARRARCGRK